MNVQHRLFAGLIAAVSASTLLAVAHAAPPRHAAAPAPAPLDTAAKDKIEYENLHGYLGDRITVHTVYHTTRTGTLTHFSKSELTLSIDTPGGAAELTIPKNTILDMLPAPLPAAVQH
jgi:hypothetical protein